MFPQGPDRRLDPVDHPGNNLTTLYVFVYKYCMGRPRKLETLTRTISGRIRVEQWWWLTHVAERRFEGETSRTLRWSLDQAQAFDMILREPDPVQALDEMLHPEKYEMRHPEEAVLEAEREFEAWKNEQAIKRAQSKATPPVRSVTKTPKKPKATG